MMSQGRGITDEPSRLLTGVARREYLRYAAWIAGCHAGLTEAREE